MIEAQLAAWRFAVAEHKTQMSFTEWLEDESSVPRYVVAIGELTVFHVIDIESKEILRVVADDFTLTPVDDMKYRYCNSQLQIMDNGLWPPNGLWPSAAEIGLAMEILDDNDGPAWEFGWDQL